MLIGVGHRLGIGHRRASAQALVRDYRTATLGSSSVGIYGTSGRLSLRSDTPILVLGSGQSLWRGGLLHLHIHWLHLVLSRRMLCICLLSRSLGRWGIRFRLNIPLSGRLIEEMGRSDWSLKIG